jgi:hypothetical protein
VDLNMNDRSGQDVGTIVSHNIPKIHVDPTVEKWEIGRRRWQDWWGFSETFKHLFLFSRSVSVSSKAKTIDWRTREIERERERERFPCLCYLGSSLSMHACHPRTVSYLPTGLAGCSVGPGISCGARKLTRTPRVTKKKDIKYGCT